MLSSYHLLQQLPLPPKPHPVHFSSSSSPSFRALCCLKPHSFPSTTTRRSDFNQLIQSLCAQGRLDQAVQLLPQERRPTQRTYEALILACARHCSPSHASAVHRHLLDHGFDQDPFLSTRLIDMYSLLGRLSHARHVFDHTRDKTIFVWNALLKALAIADEAEEALALFREMGRLGVPRDSFTCSHALKACIASSSLPWLASERVRQIHARVLRHGLESPVYVETTLIDCYAKLGSVAYSERIFDGMVERNVVSWTAMIACYAKNERPFVAMELFREMIARDAEAIPNAVTMVSVLQACASLAALGQGKALHAYILRNSLDSILSVVNALIVMYAKCGSLERSRRIFDRVKGRRDVELAERACRIHYNVELAERACTRLFELEPGNAGNYVLLADIYAEAKMWEEVTRVKMLLEDRGLQKLPGCSWIEVKKKIYSFVSVDEMNPQIEQLNALLVQLVNEMKNQGYVPNTKIVLYDLEQREKERVLLGHSEKLAVAFGLINTGNGEVIRITKNLRLCEDCHTVTKFISKFTKREILVRDVNRFHHFKDGVCSCSDYW